jgi:hypothetical protein
MRWPFSGSREIAREERLISVWGMDTFTRGTEARLHVREYLRRAAVCRSLPMLMVNERSQGFAVGLVRCPTLSMASSK